MTDLNIDLYQFGTDNPETGLVENGSDNSSTDSSNTGSNSGTTDNNSGNTDNNTDTNDTNSGNTNSGETDTNKYIKSVKLPDNTDYIIKAPYVEDINSGKINFWSGTKAEYDAIETKDSNTIYNVTDDTSTTLVANTDLSNLSETGESVLNNKADVDLSNLSEEGLGKLGGLPIGSIYPVMCTKDYIPTGALPCNGQEYTQAMFSDLWTNYLTAGLLSTCTYEEYEQSITDYGSCAKFAIDTENYKFKVPTIKDGTFIQQAQTDDELSKSYNAGLPNITGQILNNYRGILSNSLYTGAITPTPDALTDWGGTGTVKNASGFNFDASLSNPIYGNSDTVQPQAVALRYFIQVANGQINQSDIDWSKWATSLSLKQDIGDWCTTQPTETSTATIDKPCVVIENYVNGTSGYRIYSDGYCEQWGETYCPNAWVTVNFLKTFKDTQYIVTASEAQQTTAGTWVNAQTIVRKCAGDYMQISLYSATQYTNWCVRGYLADGEY